MSEAENKEVINLFIKKHPYLKDFVKLSDCVMIEIEIEKYIIVDNFQNVNILNINGNNDTKGKN